MVHGSRHVLSIKLHKQHGWDEKSLMFSATIVLFPPVIAAWHVTYDDLVENSNLPTPQTHVLAIYMSQPYPNPSKVVERQPHSLNLCETKLSPLGTAS